MSTSPDLGMSPELVLETLTYARAHRLQHGGWPTWDRLGCAMGWDADQEDAYKRVLLRKQLVLANARGDQVVVTYRGHAYIGVPSQRPAAVASSTPSGIRPGVSTRSDLRHDTSH